MGKEFATEIDYLPTAVQWAFEQNVDLLRRIVESHSGRSLLTVGSGGSSTAAAFLALLHEFSFRKLSRWVTPMGMLAHDARLDSCALGLISAEGKNRDVLAAAQHMLAIEAPGFAFTLAPDSALVSRLGDAGATVAAFQAPWGKDGYLATNSLVTTLILFARAYGVADVETYFSGFDRRWLARRRGYILDQGLSQAIAERRSICALYGRDGSIGAIDLESKMAESAMSTCQTIDYRQFAHGRHLQLADPTTSPCFLTFFSERDGALAQATTDSFPADVPVISLELPSSHAVAEIAAVIDAILVTDIVSVQRGIDPGRPDVPQFGRSLHALDLASHLKPPAYKSPSPATARKVVGRSVTPTHYETLRDAGLEFCNRLEQARFRALVCDFDGTFCNTDRRFEGLDARLIEQIERIATAGIRIGFATGRGDSLHKDLRAKLDSALWSRITIGFYSGSVIANLDTLAPSEVCPDERLGELAQWLTSSGVLSALGSSPKICGSQMSLRLADHSSKARAAAYVRQWIQLRGHRGWRIFYSGHSIDILTEHAGKGRVVAAIAQAVNCNSDDEILRLGDSGDIEGNDFELLADGIGLSVAGVSVAKESCWNLLPVGIMGAAGTRFYLQALQIDGNTLAFSGEFIAHARGSLTGAQRQ
ncbi:HAD hydrolase family protein [Paraburkholderia phenoliruptrix]|nr:HAD hydrolase family protein [Paraburkholderia phenoliruptrix]CAB4048507.1 hypothetical protein LMG9964_02148 [Paraburkholderia phenoliruptrix]